MNDEKMICFFNPENDMALANYSPYYKAPAEIVRMAADLSALPAWYAPEGSLVKIDRQEGVPRWEELANGVIPLPDVGWTTCWRSTVIFPWGWSPALVHALMQAGVSVDGLPAPFQMERLRALSSRTSGLQVLRQLLGGNGLCGEACVCRSLEEVRRKQAEWGRCVCKAPWSGSGRGLHFLEKDGWEVSVEGWLARILRTQDAVTVEPIYNKECDFAMEFQACADGKVSFVGYSLFETDAFGNYKSNLLVADAAIEQRLAAYVPIPLLHEVRRRLLAVLPRWLRGDYSGYLGVDMMIVRQPDGFAVHPCVEINLRMNMGVLSWLFFHRYAHPSAQGRFFIEHYAASGEALAFHLRMMEDYPVHLQDGKLKRGYLSLTPVFADTHYQAYVLFR